jgi:4-methylaminobutanoate oxidase (formaldehyde-forming)
VWVDDVILRWACLGLWGPRARDVLAPCTPDPLEFGYMNTRAITVGDVPVQALRVTYVGELGWELYCPMEFAGALWRTLWEAGEPHGLVAGGYRAIDSLRLEKGYRVWGADITPDDNPYEGGLAFAVKLDKAFVGREALERAGEPSRRLACLMLADPRSTALGNEPVRAGGEICGRVTSGGYGYTLGASIAYAYLPAEHAAPGTEVAVEVFGEWIDGEVRAEPLFDPDGARVRG